MTILIPFGSFFEDEDHAANYGDELSKKHSAKVHMSSHKDHITLHHLEVPKENRKKGVGSAVMKDINSFADQHKKKVVLTPAVHDDHMGTSSHKRLIKFYKGHGYTHNMGRHLDYSMRAGDMYREPK